MDNVFEFQRNHVEGLDDAPVFFDRQGREKQVLIVGWRRSIRGLWTALGQHGATSFNR
jgi:hypothetical protein